MERPVDFVSACSAATVDGLGLCAALWFGNDDTEVGAAPGAGSGKVYGHVINLTLPVGPFKSVLKFVTRRSERQGRCQRKTRCGVRPERVGAGFSRAPRAKGLSTANCG